MNESAIFIVCPPVSSLSPWLQDLFALGLQLKHMLGRAEADPLVEGGSSCSCFMNQRGNLTRRPKRPARATRPLRSTLSFAVSNHYSELRARARWQRRSHTSTSRP